MNNRETDPAQLEGAVWGPEEENVRTHHSLCDPERETPVSAQLSGPPPVLSSYLNAKVRFRLN